jgi:hypothetical protein
LPNGNTVMKSGGRRLGGCASAAGDLARLAATADSAAVAWSIVAWGFSRPTAVSQARGSLSRSGF